MAETQNTETIEATPAQVPDPIAALIPGWDGMTPEQRAEAAAERLVAAGRDLITFRANVRREAMEMARQNNLCAVVEQTLQKVGISNEMQRVVITTQVEKRVVLDVPVDLINSYTEVELSRTAQAYVANSLQGTNARAWQQVRRVRTDETPRETTVTTTERPENADMVDLFTSNEGRVKHRLRIPDGVALDTPHRTARALSGHSALCGTASYEWRADSSRDTGAYCSRCDRAARGERR